MNNNWMVKLVSHYEKIQDKYPEEKLMIIFDIDGTILDMRYMVFYVLRSYDKHHETPFFKKLQISDIKVHENQVDNLLTDLQIPENRHKEILKWYTKYRWSSSQILQSHQPFSGVLEVIRWFQLQSKTCVGLNTGRPEAIRRDTLRSLNDLGKKYKVQFPNELLHMNPKGWEQNVKNTKVKGIRHFQRKGHRIFAFVDNEPENLKAISKIDPKKEILLLHADTIFESKKDNLPYHSVKGKLYDITKLSSLNTTPQHT